MANRICSFPNCGRGLLSRGLCSTHYQQQLAGRPLTPISRRIPPPRKAGEKPCSIPDCVRRADARGLCNAHHKRLMRHGDPLVVLRINSPQQASAEDAFFSRVVPNGDCWRWVGMKDGTGYGRYDGAAAHRWAYEFLRADIPAGLFLDHLCRNRWCVNPWHTEPVTNHVNILRGVSFSAVNARKTHCPQGHEYTPENTYLYGPRKAWRLCRSCQRQHNRTANQKRNRTA